MFWAKLLRMPERSFRFVVPGKPQPKQRARKGVGGRFYTPKETREYEARVKSCAWAAMAQAGLLRRGAWPLDARYRVSVVIYPANARVPDGDNVLKAVQDGLNGLAWSDDRRSKMGSYDTREPDRENPRVEVTVAVVSGQPVSDSVSAVSE